jgi:hypothetical protein
MFNQIWIQQEMSIYIFIFLHACRLQMSIPFLVEVQCHDQTNKGSKLSSYASHMHTLCSKLFPWPTVDNDYGLSTLITRNHNNIQHISSQSFAFWQLVFSSHLKACVCFEQNNSILSIFHLLISSVPWISCGSIHHEIQDFSLTPQKINN